MSLIVPAFGSVDVVVPASGIITAFSRGAFQINQSVTNVNVPSTFTLLTNQAAGAAAPFTSSAFASGATVRIEASGGKEVSYDVGLAPATKLGRAITHQGVVVTAVNVGPATLTLPQMTGGVITSTTAAAVVLNLPAATVIDAASSWQIGEGLLWHVIATGANPATVTAAASHTVVGTGAVATLTSGNFLTVKTAAATYITYRVG